MVFNGHTEESLAQIDEVTMHRIMTMYADGVVGNFQILTTLGQLTAGVFNYMRSESQPAYKQAQIFPWINQYFENPDHEPLVKEQINDSLLTFMTQAQGFSIERFKK